MSSVSSCDRQELKFVGVSFRGNCAAGLKVMIESSVNATGAVFETEEPDMVTDCRDHTSRKRGKASKNKIGSDLAERC
ncbi:unnamed protein product [Linum trigynum]|uniref:Uncharacterized protein n=1 Tax=Linum trigynum TaxID=586398 RepID=A0AAV2DMM9_9ROSI